MGEKKYRDEQWLRQKYVAERKSTVDISEICGCSPSTVLRYLNMYDIQTRERNQQEAPDDRLTDGEWMYQKYVEEGLTTVDIAELCDCVNRTVGNWLHRHGIKTRSGGRPIAHPKLKDTSWLEKEYVEEEKSCYKIASELDTSDDAVREALIRNGIERRRCGGREREYHFTSNGTKMRRWRLNVLERDSYTCQECGQEGGELVAHHIVPKSEDESRVFDVDNGKTVCRYCHYRIHKNRGDRYTHLLKSDTDFGQYRKAAMWESRGDL